MTVSQPFYSAYSLLITIIQAWSRLNHRLLTKITLCLKAQRRSHRTLVRAFPFNRIYEFSFTNG